MKIIVEGIEIKELEEMFKLRTEIVTDNQGQLRVVINLTNDRISLSKVSAKKLGLFLIEFAKEKIS